MFLSNRDQKELDKRLLNPEFEKLYLELICLRPLHYPDLTVICTPEFSPKDLDGNPPVRFVVTSGNLPSIESLLVRPRSDGQWEITVTNKLSPSELAIAMAGQLWKEAKQLAERLAMFFPHTRRWYWTFLFSILVFNKDARIEQRQNGRAPGLSEEEKTYRRNKVKEALKLRASDPQITLKEIAKEINWRYGWSRAAIKTLARAIIEYQNGQ